jgi:hypothetical protein
MQSMINMSTHSIAHQLRGNSQSPLSPLSPSLLSYQPFDVRLYPRRLYPLCAVFSKRSYLQFNDLSTHRVLAEFNSSIDRQYGMVNNPRFCLFNMHAPCICIVLTFRLFFILKVVCFSLSLSIKNSKAQKEAYTTAFPCVSERGLEGGEEWRGGGRGLDGGGGGGDY